MINFKWKLSNATKSNKITKRCVGGGAMYTIKLSRIFSPSGLARR